MLDVEWQCDAIGLKAGEKPPREISVGPGNVDELLEVDLESLFDATQMRSPLVSSLFQGRQCD